MLRLLFVCLILAATMAAPCPAAPTIPTAPQVDARSYILVEFRTDKILAAKDAVARLEPASLTKLMTAYIVFEQLSDGKLKLDDAVMNSEAQRLGMTGSHFDNSSGLPSAQHYTTARDMSLLAAALIRDFPQYYHWFSQHEFEYNGIKQQNRNGLLGSDASVDGLKTGHTDTAGFCLVTSAQRAGMRLISVVLGSTSMKARENASAALLNYGFTFYETSLVAKAGAKLTAAEVWKAQSSPVDIGLKADLYVTVARGAAADIKTAVVLEPRLLAPLN